MKKFVALIFCAFFLLNITPSFAQTPTLAGDCGQLYNRHDGCACGAAIQCISGYCAGTPGTCKVLPPPATPTLAGDCGQLYNRHDGCACGAAIQCISGYCAGTPGTCKVLPTPVPPYKPDSYLCVDGLSVNTALGCIPVQMDKFIAWLLPVLFGISGGIAFLLMVYGFILITTSNGDPKAVQGAKETITSAVIGLLISIFAIFILRLITVGILKIPGIS